MGKLYNDKQLPYANKAQVDILSIAHVHIYGLWSLKDGRTPRAPCHEEMWCQLSIYSDRPELPHPVLL